MILFFILLFAVTLCLVLVYLEIQSHNKSNFNKKHSELSQMIIEKNKHLAVQKKKVAIVDDLKKSIKTSNESLFKQIATLTGSLFEEINRKNKTKS